MCESGHALLDQNADSRSRQRVEGSVVSVPRRVGHTRPHSAVGRYMSSVMGSRTVSPRLFRTLPDHMNTNHIYLLLRCYNRNTTTNYHIFLAHTI